MVEASSLSAAGMPEASFTLVFDASSSPLQATQLFESVVQRGASWQDAWTKFQGQRDIMREANTRMFPGLMFTKFPCILRDVTAKRSIIKCNFDVGEAWSIDTVKEWADARWTTDFSNVIWEIRPPLPDWQKLVEDNLLPNESSERRRKGKRKWRDYSYQLPT
ncbi:hypothetical protein CGMCC3_g465 [Colletotrichum fructicola]|nr:uncharacterized protein CGMCC3_g465 [Colletotrichum fructicola]KAE9583937.1 hypothetical protein CGMCC3_g465 [Colletotrichum fructicola]